MIVWLVSYPRSGNTLVRTILKSCFGLGSYDSELEKPEGHSDLITDQIGHLDIDSPVEFYDHASRTPDLRLVKTHAPPKDDQPCIYVVRDGRQAILSYYYHHRRFLPEENRSLLELILGCDRYGEWSSHYRVWDPEGRPRTLLLRYEALVCEPDVQIARIADFLGLAPPAEPWTNPFHLLQRDDPDFFRKGRAEWEADRLWTVEIDELFRLVHGGLMDRLGYRALDRTSDFVACPDSRTEFLEHVQAFGVRMLEATAKAESAAAERLALIDETQREADSRLQAWLHWQEIAVERLREIETLAREAETRRLLIERLHQDIQNLHRIVIHRFPPALGHL